MSNTTRTPTASKEFTTELVREHSAGPVVSIGTRKNRMELFVNVDGFHDCIVWNWGKDAPDEDEEVIGLWFEGNTVTDFDGVFALPREARELLLGAGYDLTAIGYDAAGNEIKIEF